MNSDAQNEWEVKVKAVAWQSLLIRPACSANPTILIEDLWFRRPQESADNEKDPADSVPEQKDSPEMEKITENEAGSNAS